MNIEDISQSILDAFKESAGDQWGNVKGQAIEYVEQTKQRFLLLSIEALSGNLQPDFIAQRAKDEIGILESQAISLGVIAAAFTQDFVSDTIEKLLTLIIDVLTKKINA